jgi:hypothetical protein
MNDQDSIVVLLHSTSAALVYASHSSTDRAGDFGLRGPGTNPGGDTVGPVKGGTCG